MKIYLIAAASINRVIGRNGKIPWNIPGEKKIFRKLTTGKTVLMGRKTYESIGHALPERRVIVLSRSKNFMAPECQVVSSLEEALKFAATFSDELFVAGGGEVYRETLPLADKIYLSVIRKKFAGDVLFPRFGSKTFFKMFSKEVGGKIPYAFNVYLRRKSSNDKVASSLRESDGREQ